MSDTRVRPLAIAVIIMSGVVVALVAVFVILLISRSGDEEAASSDETSLDITTELTPTPLVPTAQITVPESAAEASTSPTAIPAADQESSSPTPTAAVVQENTSTPTNTATATPTVEETQVVTTRPPATATGVIAPSETPTPGPVYHRVSPGETLYRIAVAYGVSVADLLASNDIPNVNLIRVGQILVIPVPPGSVDGTVVALTLEAPTMTLSPQSLSTPTLAPTTAPIETATPETNLAPTEVPPTSEPAQPATIVPLPSSVDQINGIPVDSIIVMPENVRQRAREIFESGQQRGRNPRAFSKVGDSTIENPHFLSRFDSGPYDLGIYGYLQPVIDYFAGSHSREGVAVRRGLHSWTATDPMWADKELCLPNETPIACEIRLHNPAILLIRLGSNDKGVPAGFDQNVRLVVDEAIALGVIPVIGTKADRFEGESNINNQLLRQIAAEYSIPLWDFDLVAGTLPGRGLSSDEVHLTIYYAHDYTSPVAMQRGHSVHNLTALMVLDRIWKEVMQTGG